MRRPAIHRQIPFNRSLAAAQPYDRKAWQFIVAEGGHDATLPWEGFVSRVMLSDDGDPGKLGHYDVAFKVRFNFRDEYVLAVALGDRHGGFNLGVDINISLFLGNLFTLKSSSEHYRALLVRHPETGEETGLYYGIGGYSTPS